MNKWPRRAFRGLTDEYARLHTQFLRPRQPFNTAATLAEKYADSAGPTPLAGHMHH